MSTLIEKLNNNTMKNFYFILLFFVCLYGKAQIINFPDANLKTKLLSASPSNEVARNLSNVSVKIDTNNNNEIEVSEAIQISYLKIENSNISDLTGLAFFTNLTYLNCDNNPIVNIDAMYYCASEFNINDDIRFSNRYLITLLDCSAILLASSLTVIASGILISLLTGLRFS